MWAALGDYRGPSSFKSFVRYCIARYEDKIIEKAYRVYVTESLRLIPQGMYLGKRWEEIVDVRERPERTAEEIVDHVASRLEE